MSVVLVAKLADEVISKNVVVPAGTETNVVFEPIRLEHPELWMPNGYGEPNLYELSLTAILGGKVSDEQNTRFGVRELTYELTVDSVDEKDVRINFDPTSVRGNGDIFDNRMLRPVGQEVVVPSFRKGVDLSVIDRIERDEMAPYLVIRCNGVRIYCKGGNWGMDDMMKRVSRERLEPYFILHKEAGFT